MFKVTAGAVLAFSANMCIFAAPVSSIGVAVSSGNIRINDAMTAGNANVYNGTVLSTERTAEVRMTGGAQAQLGTSSAAKLFSDHIDLQQGSASVSGLSLNASGLRIMPDSNASANVSLSGKVVMVAAVTGNVHVFNSSGTAVANLLPGRALNLTPQDAGASAPSSMTGCATKSGDVVTLTDETSNVTVQLRGGNIRAGRHITVTGTMVTGATAAGGATQVIAVTGVKSAPGACKSMAAAGAGAGAGAGAAAGAGEGAGAGTAAAGAATGGTIAGMSVTTAVVAGVAAAAVGVTAGVVASNTGGTPASSSSCTTASTSPCTF